MAAAERLFHESYLNHKMVLVCHDFKRAFILQQGDSCNRSYPHAFSPYRLNFHLSPNHENDP